MIKLFLRLLEVKCAVVGIIRKGDKILLTRRFKGIIEGGKWCLPGGGIKKWERGDDAVKREIFEETGFKVKKAKFLFYQDELVRRLHFHGLVLVFLVDIFGKGRNNWEVSEARWFDKKEIAGLDLAFSHKDILRRFFENET